MPVGGYFLNYVMIYQSTNHNPCELLRKPHDYFRQMNRQEE